MIASEKLQILIDLGFFYPSIVDIQEEQNEMKRLEQSDDITMIETGEIGHVERNWWLKWNGKCCNYQKCQRTLYNAIEKYNSDISCSFLLLYFLLRFYFENKKKKMTKFYPPLYFIGAFKKQQQQHGVYYYY